MSARFQSNADRISAPQVRSIPFHMTLSLISMLLLGLAFPSPGWWPLAHVALVPITLMAAWADRGKRLFWCSFAANYLWWLVMLGWLIGVTGGGYAALAAYMALYLPVYLLLWRLIDRRFRWPAAITVPMVWVSLEYIRGTFLQGGMAWFGLGHSQAPYLPEHGTRWLIQVADLAGDWTISFVVAASNGFVVDVTRLVLSRRLRLRSVGPSLALWLVIFGGALFYGASTSQRTSTNTNSIRVAVIQTNISQDNKMQGTPESVLADWKHLLELTRRAIAEESKPHLVVWPETIVPVPLNPEVLRIYQARRDSGEEESLRFHEEISALAREHQVDLFVGATSLLFDPFRRYNSAFHYLPSGVQSPDNYSKIDRVPFGEYIPWVENWPWLKKVFLKYLSPYGPDNDYTLTPGERRTVFTVVRDGRNLRVTVPICFEDAFARSCLALCYDRSGKRSDIMLNLTNDGWYPGTDQGLQHMQMAAIRCVENRVPMARSVNTGVSGFIDSAGQVMKVVEQGGKVQEVEGFAIHEMIIDPSSTLFGKVGTLPVVLLMILTGILSAVAFVQRR